jgi:hypothetical protein
VRLDCAVALRLGLDELQGRLIRGESIDMAKMLTASEALAKILPAAVLSAPPEERREDPRRALFDLIMAQRERAGIPDEGFDERDDEIARLQAENEQLRAVARAAGLAVPHAACGAPIDGDVVPPSEIADRDPGMGPGPDDRAPPTVIEGKAEPADDGVDIRQGFGNADEPWRQFCTDVEGNPLSGRGGRRY